MAGSGCRDYQGWIERPAIDEEPAVTMISRTADRVSSQTPDEVNERIRRETDRRVASLARSGPQAIDARLAELDREWDIERWLETGASSLMLAGTLLGVTVHRRWFVLPAAVGAFLLQHALQGWCPPLPLFRRLGVRTTDEINQERFALKALRGDFATGAGSVGASADEVLRAVRH
jgi:hypothetical protein